MSEPTYGHDTTSEEVCAYFSDQIKGRTILITGPTTTGVGFGTALAIAEQGPALLILVGRRQEALDESRDAILSKFPDAKLRLVLLDLASLSSVRKVAEELNDMSKPIDVVIANAGIMDPPFSLSEDGFESQLAANYLGHFLLIKLLLPQVLKSETKRIVLVSSSGHGSGGVRWDDPNFGEGYDRKLAYGQSKSGMILLGRYLAKEYGSQGLVAMSLDPGGISTPLQKHWDKETLIQMGKQSGGCWDSEGNVNGDHPLWKSLSQGGSTSCRAAFDPSMVNANGAYMTDCAVDEGSCRDHAKAQADVERIWAWSDALISGQKIDRK